MSQEEIKKLWGKYLFPVFEEIIDAEGWLTQDWLDYFEENVPKYDSDWNDNPQHASIYGLMMYYDFEESEDGSKIRPEPGQMF